MNSHCFIKILCHKSFKKLNNREVSAVFSMSVQIELRIKIVVNIIEVSNRYFMTNYPALMTKYHGWL